MKKLRIARLRMPSWKEAAVGSVGLTTAALQSGFMETFKSPHMLVSQSGLATLGQFGQGFVQPIVIAEAVVLGVISIYEAIKYLKRHYGYSDAEAVHELHKHISTIKKSSDNRLRKVS